MSTDIFSLPPEIIQFHILPCLDLASQVVLRYTLYDESITNLPFDTQVEFAQHDMPFVLYFHNLDLLSIKSIAEGAIKHGHKEALQWIVENYHQKIDLVILFSIASQYGHIESLDYLSTIPLHYYRWNQIPGRHPHPFYHIFPYIGANAGYSGQIKVMEWLQNMMELHDVTIDVILRYICEGASVGGKVDFLEWAQNTYPIQMNDLSYHASWDYGHSACAYAQLNVLKWAVEKGKPLAIGRCWEYLIDPEQSRYLVLTNDSDCLDAPQFIYLRSEPPQRDNEQRFEILKWLNSNGYPWNKKTTQIATAYKNYHIYERLIEHGCPT